MKEKTLLKYALICTVVGISILYVISDNIQVPIYSEDLEIGEEVKIIGRIEMTGGTDKVMFLSVGWEKIETVDVLLFKDRDIPLKEGDYVAKIGEIDDYQGKREVIANRVRLI